MTGGTQTTNSSGIAMAPALTAGSQAGSYAVTASVAGIGSTATFNLTNTVVFSNPGGSCCWVNNPTTGALNYNGFAVISNTVSTPRYFQVGGYLRF